ncbi:MAG: hypothetical protein RR191_02325 [Cetobacterium sp.]|nr:hypothetical protein [Cetobacterium sp. 2A]MBC2855675.1 hypothetical protein [Cetobacterium sp. 2A]
MFQAKKNNTVVDWAAKIYLFPLLFAGLVLRFYDKLINMSKLKSKKGWY